MSLHPVMLMPYRDGQEVKYASFSNSTYPQQVSNPYDSDAEPLISRSSNSLDDDGFQRFTATGRPMLVYKYSALSGLGTRNIYSLPQMLPQRYTDASIIPAIIVDVIPKPLPSSPISKSKNSKKGGLNTFIRRRVLGDAKIEKDGQLTKVVYMPRGDYLKYFARGLKGEYIGSEPHRRWGEEELEERFGSYRPVWLKKDGYKASS